MYPFGWLTLKLLNSNSADYSPWLVKSSSVDSILKSCWLNHVQAQNPLGLVNIEQPILLFNISLVDIILNMVDFYGNF